MATTVLGNGIARRKMTTTALSDRLRKGNLLRRPEGGALDVSPILVLKVALKIAIQYSPVQCDVAYCYVLWFLVALCEEGTRAIRLRLTS